MQVREERTRDYPRNSSKAIDVKGGRVVKNIYTCTSALQIQMYLDRRHYDGLSMWGTNGNRERGRFQGISRSEKKGKTKRVRDKNTKEH